MNNSTDKEVCFSEAWRNLVELLNRKRLADVFRFISFTPHEVYGQHGHLRIELNYVEKGTCRMLLETGAVEFRAGDLMLVPSLVVHKFEAGRRGCTLMQLEFLPEIFSSLSHQALPGQSSPVDFAEPLQVLSGQRRLLKIAGDVRIARIVRALINELKQRDLCHDYLIVLLYAELLVLLYRHTAQNALPAGMNATLKKAVAYIRQHYASPISMADIAAHAGVSERYLRRLFADQLQQSPVAYLQQVRLDKSIELLRDTKLSIKEVAYRCGFHSSQYFSRLFKGYTGTSPHRTTLPQANDGQASSE